MPEAIINAKGVFDTLTVALTDIVLVRLNLEVLGNIARKPETQVDQNFASDIGLTESAARRAEIQIIKALNFLAETIVNKERMQ